MLRDRTNELERIRSEIDTSTQKKKKKLSTKASIDSQSLDKFADKAIALRDEINAMNLQVGSLKNLHSEILTASNSHDKKQKDLDQIIKSINSSSAKIRLNLKQMGESIILKAENSSKEYVSRAELRIMKTQHSTLQKLFTDAVAEYSDAQILYRDHCKRRLKRQLEITGTAIEDTEIEQLLENDQNFSVFTQGILSDTAQAQRELAYIQERHDEIIRVEKSIQELHQMFVEISELVQNQGPLIDSIVDNVNSATDSAERGKNELNKPGKKKRKARKRKIFLGGIGTVGATILIIVLLV